METSFSIVWEYECLSQLKRMREANWHLRARLEMLQEINKF